MRILWLLAPAALLLGCGSSDNSSASGSTPAAPAIPPATVETGHEASLLPMDPGTQWVFSYEQATQGADGKQDVARMEMTWKVVKSEQTPQGRRARVQIYKGEDLIDQQDWLSNDKGIFQLNGSLQSVPFTPPQPILQFPIRTGQKYGWRGRGQLPTGDTGDIVSSSEVLGPQEVDTEQDRVSAIAVRSISDFKAKGTSGRAVVVSWFKPGVGIVRYYTELKIGNVAAATTLRLKTSTVKQP